MDWCTHWVFRFISSMTHKVYNNIFNSIIISLPKTLYALVADDNKLLKFYHVMLYMALTAITIFLIRHIIMEKIFSVLSWLQHLSG